MKTTLNELYLDESRVRAELDNALNLSGPTGHVRITTDDVFELALWLKNVLTERAVA